MESLDQLRRLRQVAAKLVVSNPVYAPIFERVETEIAELEAIAANDVVARARAVVQSARR